VERKRGGEKMEERGGGEEVVEQKMVKDYNRYS
jgi:hypothetical protein